MIHDNLPADFASHTDWLHRWFATRGADSATADDLVQLTLIEAWRNLDKLQQPGGMRPWLRAIAGHVLRRWWRSSSRETRLLHQMNPGQSDQINSVPDDRHPDPNAMLEREELAVLVSQAMDRLPAATRDLLHVRYWDDLPLADLADRCGITPSHMAVRLQRAREQLRTILVDAAGPELVLQGIDLAAVSWRSTRLWCPSCGISRLSMTLDARMGVFALTCPACTPAAESYIYNWRLTHAALASNPLRSARTANQALQRTTQASAWKVSEINEPRLCPRCDGRLACRASLPSSATDEIGNLQLAMHCPACGPLDASATFGGMAAFHPQGIAFWQEHDRIRTRAPLRATFDQTGAVRVDLVANSSGSVLTFFFSELGERLLGIVPDA